MWFFVSKKEWKKELIKIVDSFKKRDDETLKTFERLEKFHEKIVTKREIDLMIGESILELKTSGLNVSSLKSPLVPGSLSPSPVKIETKLVSRIRRGKKALVMKEIGRLSPSLSVIEMFDIIVLEKGLCSKASFYRYTSELASLKSQSLLVNEKSET